MNTIEVPTCSHSRFYLPLFLLSDPCFLVNYSVRSWLFSAVGYFSLRFGAKYQIYITEPFFCAMTKFHIERHAKDVPTSSGTMEPFVDARKIRWERTILKEIY